MSADVALFCSSMQCTNVLPFIIAGRADDILSKNVSVTLPTLERGQAIRGHYRLGDQLAIHARACLALLPAYLGSLSHVQPLRILGGFCTSLRQLNEAEHRHRSRLWLIPASCEGRPQ
jgi:hypothetical protein